MIKNNALLIACLLFPSFLFAQQVNNTDLKNISNPIIYIEGFSGISAISDVGVAGGVELNYQYIKNLFTFRYIDITGFKQEIVSPILPILIYYETKNDKEYALLYGWRWLRINHSYSISTGVSYNNFNGIDKDINDNPYANQENYFGFPFEVNVKWFQSKKHSKLLWNSVIPSIGIKFFGSISKNSFVAIGVSIGFGLHKTY